MTELSGKPDHLEHTNRAGQQNITLGELERRFTYVAPSGEARDLHQEVRALFKRLAKDLAFTLPASREKSLAFTELEQASFWAHAAIARDPSLHTSLHNEGPTADCPMPGCVVKGPHTMEAHQPVGF